MTEQEKHGILILESGDGTHQKKQRFTVYTKGMTPIEKNIRVVDEFGNEYEATYPKRAKGLVKHGRARFIDEHSICLACPPNFDLEEHNMTEQMKNQIPDESAHNAEYSVPYILSQIEAIRKDNSYFSEILSMLSELGAGSPGEAGSPGDLMGQAKADAIGHMVSARESTNQRMLQIYEKMLCSLLNLPNDSKPQMPQMPRPPFDSSWGTPDAAANENQDTEPDVIKF